MNKFNEISDSIKVFLFVYQIKYLQTQIFILSLEKFIKTNYKNLRISLLKITFAILKYLNILYEY